MGDCQNYGPFLGNLHIRCRIIIGDHNVDNHPYHILELLRGTSAF